jgi:4-amino-4-deoxy-L-arabinose transferase-like glycosyltransferase
LTATGFRATPCGSNVSAPASQIPPAPEPGAVVQRPPPGHWQLTASRERRIALALVGVLALLLGTSMIDESPTTDEPLHLTRGLAWFWGPDTSLSYSHPPLGNAVGALPVAITAPSVDMGQLRGYSSGEVWVVAKDLLGTKYGRRRPWIFEARAMIALCCVLLAVYVYRLGTRFFGPAVGLCALGFFAFHPTLIAHGRMMTTDMPVALAMVVAVGELVTFLNGGSRWHGAAAAFAVGAGMVTKYTGLMLVPIASLGVLVVAGLRVGRYRGWPLRRALTAAVVYLALSGLAALFVINAAYRFHRSGATAAQMLAWPEPAPDEPRGFGGAVLEKSSILPKLPGWLPIPLPYTYVFGLSVLRAHDAEGHPTVFFGKPMSHGTPAYFPIMLLIKTPLVLMAALGYAGFVFWRRRGRVSLPAALLAAYATCFVLLAMRAALNIGVRHVLPMIPIMALFAGLGAVYAFRALASEARRKQLAIAAIVAAVGGVAWSFPDYLSDFNCLVGGKIGGERVSIVGEEWGQDTLRLGRALRERGISTVYFSGDSFTSKLELARQQVTSRRLGCPNSLPENAYVAVQARDIARQRDTCVRWTKTRTPEFDVNGHVYVYRTGAHETPF